MLLFLFALALVMNQPQVREKIFSTLVNCYNKVLNAGQ
jgi:hypothetical protein